MHRYQLSYDMQAHPGGLTKEEAERDLPERGLTDAMVVFSLIYPPDGSLSMASFTLDGRTGEALEVTEIWKVWSALAAMLAESRTLPNGHRELAGLVIEVVRAAVQGRPMPDPDDARRIALGVWVDQAKRNVVLEGLVTDLVDSDPCHLDHHGYCQAHGWMKIEPACPHSRAKQMGIQGG